MKRYFTLILLLLSLVSYGQHCPPMDNKLEYTQYCLDWNPETRNSNLVYYTVMKDSLGSYGRYDFGPDDRAENCQNTWDYADSGYDRGHLFAAASANSIEAASDSFYMTNMSPQLPNFNRGIWKSLETLERQVSDSVLYVICGPILEGNEDKLPGTEVVIPNRFFKILYSPKWDMMIGFIIPQEYDGNLVDYQVTVDYLESLLNIEFFETLPESEQSRLESTCNYWDWT